MIDNFIAAFTFDEPPRNQAPHRMRDDMQCLAVTRAQSDALEAFFEQPRVFLDRGMQVFIIEGKNCVIGILERFIL